VLFVALTLDFPGGLAHWFSLVHIPYRCERAAQLHSLLPKKVVRAQMCIAQVTG